MMTTPMHTGFRYYKIAIMLLINDEQIVAALPYHALIGALENMFRSDYEMPVRHHHFYATATGHESTLILMPAWNKQYLGVKQVVVAGQNSQKNLPAIHALYTLSDAATGIPLAIMNAAELTSRRTACTSALAARYLAPKQARKLLVVGGGKVASHLIQAHKQVRSYDTVSVWMRNTDKLAAFIAQLKEQGIEAVAVADLEAAVREADVISTATLSKEPVIKGEWVKKGAHLDLIGSHKPDTREVDDEAILKSELYVDSREGALHETGELAIPIAKGILQPADVRASIKELCKGSHPGRQSEDETTLFKSAGLAVEDLAAALLVYRRVSNNALLQ